jgi:16S rRNA (cytosine967-C5)-methyltransferase
VTPGARIQAATELLERLERPPAGEEDLPADAVLNDYFRSRRYIGAKDRRAIGDVVYQTLRQRGFIDWWLVHEAGLPSENLFRAVWAFGVHQGLGADDIVAACDGGRHRPGLLDADAQRRIRLLAQGVAEAPETVYDQASFPGWLAPEIERRLGGDTFAEMIAFTQAAPVDLRVNTLQSTREEALAALTDTGVAAAPTPLAPHGIRLEGRVNLAQSDLYRDGRIEVQDESSQVAALLVGAMPGMRVLDLCAGAGGKTLALAAAMGNRGKILAGDTDAKRLARLAPRLARSGATIVETRALGTADKSRASLGAFDRVLVDAPCSGSGTWRRRPETKWRLTPQKLAGYRDAQAALLREAAEYVKPNGRLIYAVCSILPSECEDQVEAFVAGPGAKFRVVPLARAWREARLAAPAPGPGPYLGLSPHRHRTDGFFAAVLERAA